jgi:hypothetical protein
VVGFVRRGKNRVEHADGELGEEPQGFSLPSSARFAL